MCADFRIRLATLEDTPGLRELIAASARAMHADYTAAQIESALGNAFGLDQQLILDGSYFAVEAGANLLACGGWGRRTTLFGSSAAVGEPGPWLDPAHDAARLRAFFIHPHWTRRGIGRALLARCEAEAKASGFHRMELMATFAGRRLYRACGYLETEVIQHVLPNGTAIEFVPMHKVLD